MRQDVVPARKRVAVTLYWLGRGSYYDDVALIFGIGKITVHQILHETVGVMNEQLVPHAIKWPGDAETFQNIVDFEALCGMPQCGGAIDGCFIPMEVPAGPHADKYWCYKNTCHHPIGNLGRTWQVPLCQPGSVRDAAAFSRSAIQTSLEEGTAFSAIHDKQFPNPYGGFITVKPFIVGDSAFALAPYMIRNSNCNPPEGSVEHAYDYVHIRTRYFAATYTLLLFNVFWFPCGIDLFCDKLHSCMMTDHT